MHNIFLGRPAACAVIGLAALSTHVTPAAADQRPLIAQILPKKPGDANCFAATFPQPVAMNIEDWSDDKVKMEPMPGQFDKNGRQMTRPVPALMKGRKVKSLAMHISAENLNPGEPFNFVMRAKIKSWKRPIYAAGICAYPKDAAGKSDETRLGCYIECDGGSVGGARVSDTSAVAVFFDRDGLRMTSGCSDESGPSYRVKSTAETQTFKLKPVAGRQCGPLKAWLKRQ